MNRRITTTIGVALVSAALAAPGAQAAPGIRHHHAASGHRAAATIASSAFSNLGHEGSGLHAAVPVMNAFSGLGIEGGALVNHWLATENAWLAT